MIAPRGLLGASLALWGASIGFTVTGIILGLVYEAARFMPRPAIASPRRLVLVVRLCVGLAAGALVYAGVTGRFPQAIYAWLQWLPVLVLPLPLAQALAGGSIPGGAILAAFRVPPRAEEPPAIDTTHAFVAIALVAAATGARSETWFYWAAAAIVAWALAARVPRTRWVACAALAVAGIAAGYAVHRGLWLLQGELEELDPEVLMGLFTPNPDPFRERTRIGDMKPIKLNDRILMRVAVDGPKPPQVLLRESAFDHYQSGEWKTASRAFRPAARDGERWILREGTAPATLTVRRSVPREGLLALPLGAHVVDHLPAESLESLPTGAVRARGAPRFVAMRVAYQEASEAGSAATDLEVPPVLAPVLDRVIAEHSLAQGSQPATVAAVERFFNERFAYSLNLNDSKVARTRTLADFLLNDHKGHCEYFATATVLLLRRAGIPARYTVGYSAQEYSPRERAFLVRHRHAHAWTSALVDGRWITVDTTPARWAADEGEAARSPFADLLDLASWAIDRVVQWWIDTPGTALGRALGVIVVIALLVPFAIYALRWWRRRAASPATAALDRATLAWHAVESLLARRGYARERGETVQAWARRLQREPRALAWRGEFADLARAYYRARFDPSVAPDATQEFVRATGEFRRRLRKPTARLARAGAE